MKKLKLDKEEQTIEDEAGTWLPISGKNRARIEAIIEEARKSKKVKDKIKYTSGPIGRFEITRDFLPSPDKLVYRTKTKGVMTTLTLKLDSHAVVAAKQYLRKHPGLTMSKLVENFFNSLEEGQPKPGIERLPPIVSQLAGVARKGRATNLKDEYAGYLIEKYK